MTKTGVLRKGDYTSILVKERKPRFCKNIKRWSSKEQIVLALVVWWLLADSIHKESRIQEKMEII